MKKIKYESIPDYGHHMTLKEFIEAVKSGCLIDYDGYGRYATATQMTNKSINPSDISGKTRVFDEKTMSMKNKKVKKNLDKRFTHVVWFNR